MRRMLSSIRFRDILLLQGAPLLGAAFSFVGSRGGHGGLFGAFGRSGELGAFRELAALALFSAASFLLVAHVFVFNDWAGVDADLKDAHKVAGVFATKGVSRQAICRLWIGLLALSLVMFGLLGVRPLGIALAIAACSFLYSKPVWPAKSVPIFSSILHLLGGSLHFLLGFSLFRPIDDRAIAFALFFGLAFTAGHLNQEVRDFDGDVNNGIQTNAAAFGKTAGFLGGLVVFAFSYAMLVAMALGGFLPRWLAGLALLFPLHLYWSLQTLRRGLSFESVSRLQTRYRALYALIGAAILLALLITPPGL